MIKRTFDHKFLHFFRPRVGSAFRGFQGRLFSVFSGEVVGQLLQIKNNKNKLKNKNRNSN
jgi:hypothetical protein